jgi:hypothetical protein
MTARNLSLFDGTGDETPGSQAVECLGMTFESDEARREYFLGKLRDKLQDPEFRETEGFPLGKDEDILALSDPPYYTACPNPFMENFVQHCGKLYDPTTDDYKREPFATDVSEGKTDSLYTAHGYATKVPHKAIMRYILHYTEPEDLILDGFAGSGMTGVAAQVCGKPDLAFKQQVEAERKASDLSAPVWGSRRVILNDIGIAATFISANYNLPFDVKAFEREGQRILRELKQEIGWMYETLHADGRTKCQINYTVWSDVFGCPDCTGEVVFLNEALEPETKRVKEVFPCPHCSVELTKKRMERLYENNFDPILNITIKQIKRQPVLINYSVGQSRYEKKPDRYDLENLQKIENISIPANVPTDEIPFMHMTHQRAKMAAFGITHVHHFFLRRAAQALGRLWEKATAEPDPRLRHMLLFFVEQAIWGMSVLNRYKTIMHGRTSSSNVNQYLSGIYYVPSQHSEVSPWYNLSNRLERLVNKAFKTSFSTRNNAIANVSTTANLNIPENSIDYIFTDPPFGENIYYADLNFLVESWHKVKTNAQPEAIIDKAKGKKLIDYQRLMQRCFEQYYRVLKPGRWMTVVFHNSQNAVWNALQEGMLAAGFVVADVRTLDKQQSSYRQITSTAVKQDLIITAYKPSGKFETRFKPEAGTEKGAWEFVQEHLEKAPMPQTKAGELEVIAERLNYLLFDRMVAFHVQRGLTVPLSAPEFYAELEQRFVLRDDMYFLPEQVAEYDKKRMTVKEVLQLELFVTNESTAVQWLRQQLLKKPQTFPDLQPQYLREIAGWSKNEKPLELRNLLQQNFLPYNGVGRIPKQIVAWLEKSSIYRDLIRQQAEDGYSDAGLDTQDVVLLNAARERFYVPDPKQESDLIKLRERALLKEFEEYRQSKQKQLKVFRIEAVRIGFQKAWKEREYQTIVEVASKIPENVLQEDQTLLMFRDNAVTFVGED